MKRIVSIITAAALAIQLTAAVPAQAMAGGYPPAGLSIGRVYLPAAQPAAKALEKAIQYQELNAADTYLADTVTEEYTITGAVNKAGTKILREAGEEPEEKEGGAGPDLKLYAQSAVLMDADSGRVLYGKNEAVVRPMASTTKIMTCIVALEHGNLEDVVTASKTAAGQPKVHLGVSEGETFCLKDLLYSLMLESHNDAAVMIAEQVGGSVEGFAELMNQKARDLGCSDTYFITPNGLDATVTDEAGVKRQHATTAADLSRIMRYCVNESPKKDQFLEITQTQNYYFTDTEGKHSFNCTNHNAFLSMMNGMLSGKTGFTGGAGYSYVGALRQGDRTYVIALLGCGWPPHKTYKWSDARKLFQYGLDNYKYKEVFENKSFDSILVRDGIPVSGDLGEPARVELSMGLNEEERSLKLLLRPDEKVEVRYDLPGELKAPLQEEQVVGSAVYSLAGQTVKAFPVYVCDNVEKIDGGWCFKKAVDSFLSMPGAPMLPGM